MEKMSESQQWASAVDPKTGRIYYYNTKTKETTWNKPLSLATPEERAEIEFKRNATLQFFKEMEFNIKTKIFTSEANNNANNLRTNSARLSTRLLQQRMNSYSYGSRNPSSEYSRPTSMQRYVRTISSIDDDILTNLKLLQLDESGSNCHRSISPDNRDLFSIGLTRNVKVCPRIDTVSEKRIVDSYQTKTVPNNLLRRRNSTGTIFIGNTMSVQDNDATISCVCVVIRTHMLDAASEGVDPLPQYDIFKDAHQAPTVTSNSKAVPSSSNRSSIESSQEVPSLATVRNFFNSVFTKSQLESECIIIALIYCERLVRATKGKLCIRYDNWRSILFACLVMASKVWDDMSMWNIDFSQVLNNFDLQRINALELAILGELKYTIRVSASEYAKYYFHLRSMMARLGFHSNESSLLQPLNLLQAKKLQLATEEFAKERQDSARVRSKTAEIILEENSQRLNRLYTMDGFGNERFEKNTLVGLEQIIHSQHMDADGSEHRSRNTTPRQHSDLNSTAHKLASLSNIEKPMTKNEVFESHIARKAFRTENCQSWNAGDDEDFKYTRK